MQRVATLTRPRPPAAAFNRTARLRAWLQHAWQQLTLDADERYIRGASDLADLECRQRKLARGRDYRLGAIDFGA